MHLKIGVGKLCQHCESNGLRSSGITDSALIDYHRMMEGWPREAYAHLKSKLAACSGGHSESAELCTRSWKGIVRAGQVSLF
jgi:hypothetical protein